MAFNTSGAFRDIDFHSKTAEVFGSTGVVLTDCDYTLLLNGQGDYPSLCGDGGLQLHSRGMAAGDLFLYGAGLLRGRERSLLLVQMKNDERLAGEMPRRPFFRRGASPWSESHFLTG